MVDIIYRTTDTTRWGAGKGSNLTPTEADTDLWNLAQAIVDLQNNPAQPVGIASIDITGTQMTISLTDGETMGPFTIPVLTFHWRGAWEPATSYAVLDVFTVSQVGIFSVLLAHMSGAAFDPNIQVAGQPALLQLFGATDASLEGLSDVQIVSKADGDGIHWSASAGKWVNFPLGTMATQNANAVAITSGTITGMPTPTNAADVATKAYVDGVASGGGPIPDGDLIANITGSSHVPAGVTLSAYLDHVFGSTTRGQIIYRGASGWVTLAPGTSGQFLKTLGSGADPLWAAGAAGVTDIAPGTGITTGGADITSTGTIGLAPIANLNLLANISGGSAAPVPQTVSALLDATLTNNQGSIIIRSSGGWSSLPAGTSGKYLKTQGALADPIWDSPAGAGTVTSISAGTGIDTGGSPITSTGTVALAAVADSRILANISGSSAAPTANSLSLILDHIIGSAQGDVIFRGASTWGALTPGTNGQVLTSGGAAANVSWQNAPSGAAIADARILANISGGSASAIGDTLSDILDYIVGSSRSTILFRGGSAWAGLAPGTTGQLLQTNGPTADPSWATVSGVSNTLAGLTDVSITTPLDGQFLTYITSAGKWENRAPSSSAYPSSNTDLISYQVFLASPWKPIACGRATTAALPACTYANGSSGVGATLTANANGAFPGLDGAGSGNVNDTYLIKNQATGLQNGVYTLTQQGDGSHPWILTRATWYDTASATGGLWSEKVKNGDVIAVTQGSTLSDTLWMLTNSGSGTGGLFIIGTDTLTFAQCGGTNIVTASGSAVAFNVTSAADKDIFVYDSGSSKWLNSRQKYELGFSTGGVMTNSQHLGQHRFSKAVTLPANCGSFNGHSSQAGGTVTATASTVININKANTATPTSFSNVGSITIAAGTVTPTFATSGSAAVTFAAGDVIQLAGPATADATLADFYASLVLFET